MNAMNPTKNIFGLMLFQIVLWQINKFVHFFLVARYKT